MRVGLRMAWASVMKFKMMGNSWGCTHTHRQRVKCEVSGPVRALGVVALDDRSPRTP